MPRIADIAPEDLLAMLRIRRFEELLLRLFQSGELNGTTHTCIGQEAVPVAVMPLLRNSDFVFSNHRGHGHYLARFDDPAGLLAEIMGREGAVCSGVGGSQHIKRGRYLSTGVQGESLPVATGVALALAREGEGAIAVPFIGDGTWGEGAVYEALNIAALHRAPLAVIVEHNRIAQTTPTVSAMAGTIAARAAAFGCAHLPLSGWDIPAARASLIPALERLRAGGPPLIVEWSTARLAAHSKSDDTRPETEITALRAADWETAWHREDPESFARADHAIREEIDALHQTVQARPLSRWTP